MPEDIIRFARAYCAERLPWFAPALFRTRILLTDQVAVAAIDPSLNIYFNPTAVQKIDRENERVDTLAQLGYIWIHEISHVLREHNQRAVALDADARLWNMAADYEINDSEWEDLHMPAAFPGLRPQQHQLPVGQIAEFYYRKLLKKQEKQKQLPQHGMDEGSGVHGQSRPWEVTAQQQQQTQKLTSVELKLIQQSVAQALQRARAAIGNLSGGWAKWIDDTLHPKVNWRKRLSHRMSIAINTGIGSRMDYSFARPSRRQSVYHPILTPTLRGDMAARIAVVIDTSGSMSAAQLGQAMAEVGAVLRTFRVPVTIIPCDLHAYEPIQLQASANAFAIQQLEGGGGTDMRVGIAAALELKPRPDSILVLTDGFTPYPTQRYKIPVIFGILSFGKSARMLPPNPPFGTDAVVEIEL